MEKLPIVEVKDNKVTQESVYYRHDPWEGLDQEELAEAEERREEIINLLPHTD